MKKKSYSAPRMVAIEFSYRPLMADGSVTGVGGSAGLTLSDGDGVPTEAGSRRGSLWDDAD